ncbi:hypothetical protein ABZU25_28100 [Micromonospora sp. NPDC005215]|uniref:hypothetical protein n=1 Tax=Micromonospora sp. NPDC005215 TaxID=3157024 RepID=UPI0033A218CC
MSVEGKWQLTTDSPLGKQRLQLDLQTAGDRVTGTVTNLDNGLTTEVLDGAVSGADLHWKMKMSKFNVTLTFTTVVDKNTIAGTVKAGMFGSFPVSGVRE